MGEGSAVDDPLTGPARRQAFGMFHKEQLGFVRASEIGTLRLAELALGESRDLYVRYIDTSIDGLFDEWIDICLEQFPGPLVWKVILEDPIHLSVEGRVLNDEENASPAIVRLGSGNRSYFRGDTFLADPPWVLSRENDVFEDPSLGVRITREYLGVGGLCNAAKLRVQRIARTP